jgi:hypothetical protein
VADSTAVWIRRLPDRRTWLGRRARYEIQHALARVVTETPGLVLRPLVGSSHPADLAAWTEVADLAWDGGTGPWRGAVAARARRHVRTRVGRSLSAALTSLGHALRRTGDPAAADRVGALADELRLAKTPEARAAVIARVRELCVSPAYARLEPHTGSLMEQTVCRLLSARVAELAGR